MTLQSGDNVLIAVSIKSGADTGKNADCWIIVQHTELTGFNALSKKLENLISSGLSDIKPGYRGALVDLDWSFELLSSFDIPKAPYEIFFGVDQNIIGVLGVDGLVFESV